MTGLSSRRCPKTKYETGTTPAELTSATAAVHTPFRPRIWLQFVLFVLPSHFGRQVEVSVEAQAAARAPQTAEA